ncbi:hypothetical protein POTOM_031881 [Populus tomentosa]|uniref:CAAX prenyl protease 2/Lysostaphin resistance protein A-like domain-containing protein n=1 Tax=Populus tomentosa TaxID=118781 RepID=A0A8X7Z4Z4_POPTO|nr:hypothetical protein POTOM_031881 [Populus tomentosa]
MVFSSSTTIVPSSLSCLAQSSLYCLSDFPILVKRTGSSLLSCRQKVVLLRPKRRQLASSIYAGKESKAKVEAQDKGLEWPIIKRWDVPWPWQTISLTSLACGISFILTGLVEATAIPYLGIKIEELSLDEKAEILLLDQSIATAVVLGVLYGILNTFQPLPEDVFRYDLKEPFNLEKGWLLWAGIGLASALLAVALTGVAVSTFSGETPQRETDALVRLLPLIGSSSIRYMDNRLFAILYGLIVNLLTGKEAYLYSVCSCYLCSTACLIAITGVLAPVLEENVFRGFFMVSLTKWVPTPVSVLISAAVFALAHLTPGEFPQLFVLGKMCRLVTRSKVFVKCPFHDEAFFFEINSKHVLFWRKQINSFISLGTALGFSYAQTRNLLTPITIHAFWNSGVVLILTLLQLQGYDIKDLLQAT